MLSQERLSRRDFNIKFLTVVGGGLAFAAGCTSSDKTKQKIEIQPTKEPLQKWSRVVVPIKTGIYTPVKGLDSSQLGITDLFVYSNPGDEIAWYAVALQNFNPNLPDIEFYLAKYKENFTLEENTQLLSRPPVENISDQSMANAISGITGAIPLGSDLTITRPIDVVTPITKPTDKDDYVFIYKSQNPQYALSGFVPIRFSFEASTKSIA